MTEPLKDLSRQEILDCDDDPKPVAVDVPEWGGRLYVRPISGAERDEWERRFLPTKRGGTGDGFANVRASLVALCACDAKGDRLFRRSDVVGLGQKFSRALDRVFDAASDLNGISATDVQELEKNSETPPPADSGSDSPLPAADSTSTDSSAN